MASIGYIDVGSSSICSATKENSSLINISKKYHFCLHFCLVCTDIKKQWNRCRTPDVTNCKHNIEKQ